MTAPGMNYDYFEGQSFRARTKDLPDLAAAIEAHVREHFDQLPALNKVDSGTRAGEMAFAGQRFGYVVVKTGPSRLVLQQLWNAETEKLDLAKLEASIKLLRKK